MERTVPAEYVCAERGDRNFFDAVEGNASPVQSGAISRQPVLSSKAFEKLAFRIRIRGDPQKQEGPAQRGVCWRNRISCPAQ